jgi:ABC-type sugar transport system ATPase subunit
MKVIEIKNLKKAYRIEKLDVPVNLEITQGEFVAIMGPVWKREIHAFKHIGAAR